VTAFIFGAPTYLGEEGTLDVMAKEDKDGTFQFVFLNLKGDQATIQEAVRQAGQILSGMNPSQTPTKTYIAVPVSPQQLGDGNGNANGAGQQIFEVVPEEVSTDGAENASASTTPVGANQQRPRRAPRPPAYMKDIDPNDAEVTLADFAKQKGVSNESTQYNQYLVIGAWFQKYKSIAEIKIGHIFTCYQLLKWVGPDNLGQPFRDMKKNHHYFENGSKKGLWEITIAGLNEVDRMGIKNSTEDV
jgi:hypothetical protein